MGRREGSRERVLEGGGLVEDNKYENIIRSLTYEQLVYESAILNEQEVTLYNKKKSLKEEFKRRLRESQE